MLIDGLDLQREPLDVSIQDCSAPDANSEVVGQFVDSGSHDAYIISAQA